MKNPAATERGSQTRVPTVAEVCERHVATITDARTASTYRARLRSVIAGYGEMATPAALRKLGEIEADLAAESAAVAAHKAVILFKAAARAAGFELLTLIAASELHGVALESLRTLAGEGRIHQCYRRRHGRGDSILFDPDELAEDLRGLERCREPGCDRAGTGPSGFCGEHFGQAGRQGARDKEDRILAAERDWWTVVEAARRAGVAHTMILAAIGRGELPSVKDGRYRQVPKAGLAAWRRARQPGKPKPTPEQRQARRSEIADLWERGYRKPGELAGELRVSKHTVRNDLDALGLHRAGKGRRARRLPPGPRAARAGRVVDRYRAFSSYRDIERDEDVSPTEIARILKDAGVTPRPKRRQPKHPPAGPRPCEWCGETFTPKNGASDVRAGRPKPRRFCTDDHARQWREAQGAAALAARGLLSTAQAGEEIGLGAHRVIDLLEAGKLDGERVSYLGAKRPLHGVARASIQLYLRRVGVSLAEDADGRRVAPLRPELAIARAERDGNVARLMEQSALTREEAHGVIRGRVKRRRQKLAQHAKGPRPNRPAAHHLRWLEGFDALAEERSDHSEKLELGVVDRRDDERYDEADGWATRSDFDLAKEIAQRDWREHPEDWPRDGYRAAAGDPERMHPRQVPHAGKWVLKTIKRLQKQGTEKQPR